MPALDPAALCNQALDRIGYPERIGTMRDGTKQARLAIDVYGQTRDELLREQDWGFARRDISLTLLKSAPPGGYILPGSWNPATNPPVPWRFEYVWPSDCLMLRSINRVPMFLPEFEPQTELYQVVNDQTITPPTKVILANAPNAVAVYTGQITDTNQWEPLFVETLISALGRRFAQGLGTGQQVQTDAVEEVKSEEVAVRRIRG